MIEYALKIGEGRASYGAWARKRTVAEKLNRSGLRGWFAKKGYEIHIEENNEKDSGGEPHISLVVKPKS